MNLATFPPRVLLAALGLFLSYPSLGNGQELSRSVRLTDENDYLVFWVPPQRRTDGNYTQGVRLSVDLAATPGFSRRLVCRHRPACGTTMDIGQEIYTPTADAPEPLPGERPYAGWLYARGAARTGGAGAARSLALTVGITGPASLAESVQKGLHRRVPSFKTPLGWEHQLPTEVAFAIRAEQAWRIAPPGAAHPHIDLVPSADLTLGTLRTAMAGGGRLRVGTGLNHPWLTSTASPRFGLTGFVGVRGDIVARDLFLDGSTFRRSVSVEREPVVLAWERGLSVSFRRFGVEYRAVTRSREYRTGPKAHTHGSLTMLWMIR